MAWDKDKPAGSQKIRLSDEEIRANNAALEDALGREHTFPGVMGGTAGQHPAGSTTQAGLMQLATVAEAQAGTSEAKAVTPLGLASSLFATMPGAFSRLKVFNNAVTPASKVDITADAVVLLNSSNNPFIAKAVSLSVNCGSTGANALDTGSLSNNNWYYFYIIAKADGTVAGLGSASATSPTMPADYIYKKLVSAVYYGTAAFRVIRQYGIRLFYTGAALSMFTASSGSWTSKDLSPYVPGIAISLIMQPFSPDASLLLAVAWDASDTNKVVFEGSAGPAVFDGVRATNSPCIYALNPSAPQTMYAKSGSANTDQAYLKGYELDI